MTTKTDDQEMTRNVCRRQIDSLARLELMIVEANYNGPDADAVQTFIDEEGLPDDEIFSGYDLLSFWLDVPMVPTTRHGPFFRTLSQPHNSPAPTP